MNYDVCLINKVVYVMFIKDFTSTAVHHDKKKRIKMMFIHIIPGSLSPFALIQLLW